MINGLLVSDRILILLHPYFRNINEFFSCPIISLLLQSIIYLLLIIGDTQLHADSEPLLSDLHGLGLGLLCLYDGEEHRAGEGDEVERDSEGHGCHQPCALVHMVHRHVLHDGLQHSPAYSHYHGKRLCPKHP